MVPFTDTDILVPVLKRLTIDIIKDGKSVCTSKFSKMEYHTHKHHHLALLL